MLDPKRTSTPPAQLRLLASIVQSSDDAIISESLDGVVTSWNAAAERMYGYPVDETMGQPVSVLMPPDKIGEMTGIAQRISDGEPVEHYETVRRRKDGSLISVSLTVSPVHDDAGRVVGVSSTARDITEKVKVQEQMLADLQREVMERKNAEESYARSNADLEQFAYVASHDLSEPLRAISGPISLVARRYEGKLDPESDQFIAFAVDGCQRMQAIIEGLLAYSRVGRLEAPFAPVDCNLLLATVLGWLAPVIDAAGGEVTVGDLPLVLGEGTQLSQVFLNLISNAVKFVAPGVSPRVDVRAERAGRAWRFSVTDNGIGIVPEHRDRVFGMFKRLHGREDYAGTGIGLALVKKIVERHGGTIGVDAGPDGGSRFWFTIDTEVPR
jgi:PAS domain S-box-containing protein